MAFQALCILPPAPQQLTNLHFTALACVNILHISEMPEAASSAEKYLSAQESHRHPYPIMTVVLSSHMGHNRLCQAAYSSQPSMKGLCLSMTSSYIQNVSRIHQRPVNGSERKMIPAARDKTVLCLILNLNRRIQFAGCD